MFKRKLFKRALPVILSIAMVFQSMPATSLAAELPVQEATADSGTLDEDSGSDSGDAEAENNAAGESNPSDSASDENTQDENISDGDASNGDASNGDVSNETVSGESTSSEDVSESQEETAAPTEEAKQPAVDETEVQRESETSADSEAPNEETTNGAKIVIDADKLQTAAEKAGLSYDEETGTVFARYDADSTNPFAEILKGYYTDDFGEDIYFLSVELNGKANEDLRKQLGYTWKNEDGTNLADSAAVPKNKGSYQLSINLDKIDNLCEATSASIKFRIDPCDVMVDYSAIDSIVPGIAAREAAEIIREGYRLYLTDIDGNETKTLSKEAFVESCTVSIIKETDESGTKVGTELAPEDKIQSNAEYSVKLAIVLTDKENYTISNTSRTLDVMNGIDTIIRAETVNADGTSFGWKYGEQPDMEKLKKSINAYVVEAGSDAAEEKRVADAEIQYDWFDADENPLEEEPGAESNAGTYWLRLSYDGEPGLYNAPESTVAIQIVISAVDVYIGGIQTDTAEYVDGAKAANVIQSVTGYEVYKIGDTEKKNIMDKDDKYFWGVSYNGDADENTQSYEPVFKIRRGRHVTDADGKDSVVWDSDYLSGSERLVKTQSVDGKDVTYEYRIEFSGKKAVYGEGNAPIDINMSQENYRVDVTGETLAANAFPVKLAVEGPVIDVSEMRTGTTASEENKGSLTNPIIKIYDAEPFFKTKDEYKKAKVTGSTVPSTDLTYQWQEIETFTEITDADNNKDIIAEDIYNVTYNNVEYQSAPTEAGSYRIAVSYTDSVSGAVSKTEYVYYTIKKEDILIQPDSKVPAYYGETVSAYLADIKAALRVRTQSAAGDADAAAENLIDYTISDFTEGADKRELADAAWLDSMLRYYEKNGNSALTWSVERKITEGANAGSWYELQNSDTFVEGAEYRLCVRADWQNVGSSYSTKLKNYNNRYELDFKNEQIVDEQTGAYKLQGRYADQQTTAITPIHTEGIEVTFEVDWDKITQTTKVYDGLPFGEAVQNAVKGAVKAYNKKTGEAIDSADINIGWRWTRTNQYGSTETSYVGIDGAIHAGNYHLMLSVEKGEKYLGQSVVYSDSTARTFTITPAELTVTPVLKDEVKAGTHVGDSNAQNVKNIVKSIDVEGNIAENDKTYLVDWVRYYAFTDISYPWCIGSDAMDLKVTDKTTGKQLEEGYLKSQHGYNARFDFDGRLQDYYVSESGVRVCKFFGSDYTLKFATVAFTAVRASSIVYDYSFDEENSIRILDSVTKAENNFTHTIAPREGIPYSYGSYNKEEKYLGGNYFGIAIYAPEEYTDVPGAADRVIYQNSIENAGGYIDYTDTYDNQKRIYVIFDAAKVAEDGGKSFEITWEEGFTEQFRVEVPKNLLMQDLQRAVLPKSLAFNGAVAKMAVGEGQQLDLKITKAQMADIICVAYESSDENVLTVSDSGYVTAVHTGKATVTAYAAYESGEDGTIQPFLDAKGNYAKAAKLNVTVNKLSEVKKIKFEAHDTYALIDYADVPDGYRREVYVLAGTNIAASEFETRIDAVKNGDYSAFDAHLFITDTERKTVNSAGKKFWGRISGLLPNTQYTVYVRNVSALRTLPNGAQIDAKEFATASKVAKLATTKSQQVALNGYFKTAEDMAQPVRGKTTVKVDPKSAVTYRANGNYYVVDIAAKSAMFNLEAKYWQKDQADINYADSRDYIWYPLALAKDLQKDYVDPKLTYYVSDSEWTTDEPYNWKDNGYIRVLNEYDEYCYFKPATANAAIDKKGKISLKGNGWVYVFAYDAEQRIISDAVELYITSAVDGLAGKPIKMKVGTTVLLSEYLTYKQKNIKLSAYDSKDLVVTWDDPDGAFEIIPQVLNGETRVYDYYIKAKRPTTKPLELNVSDKIVKANGGADIKIKLSATAIDAVKSLKAYDVYDTEGMIRFDYAANTEDYNLKFRIEVKDQTGKILANRLVSPDWRIWKSFYNKDAEYYDALYHQNYGYDEDYERIGFREYNAKKKTWTYHYPLTNLGGLNLTRLSSYTASVTAVYDGYDAKTASTKVKTTNIPASKTNAVQYDDNGKDRLNDGGGTVVVYKNSYNTNNSNKPLSDYMLLKSGSTYTLDFTGGNKNARNMKTDTLTWKSSNTKVATVKANPGTFTAAFKAVKKGTTQITVTSKITKKVIARWTVFVTAVGEADGYFGDNIYQDTSDADLADKLGADMLTLNKSMSYTLGNGEKKWVAFRAPADGRYSVSASGGSYLAYDSDSRPLGSLGSSYVNKEMTKGTTVYFLLTVTNAKKGKRTVTISVAGTQYTSLTTGEDGNTVRGGSTVVFTAPEENVYTFRAFDKNGAEAYVLNNSQQIESRLKKNQKVSYYISGTGEYTVKVTAAEKLADGTGIALKAGETKCYKFTADETSEYTIYTVDAAEKIDSGSMHNSDMDYLDFASPKASSDTDTDPKNVGFATRKLTKGTVVYIKLTAGSADTGAKFKVEKAEKMGTAFTIADANGTKTVVYNADAAGDYDFTASGTDVTITGVEINGSYYSNASASYQTTLQKGAYVKLTVSAANANTSVTVTCTPVKAVPVKVGTPASVSVTNGLSRKVTFAAAQNGWYAFDIDNQKVSAQYTKSAGRTVRAAYTSGTEIYVQAGETLTFILTTAEATAQEVNVTASKKDSVKLTNMSDATTLTKGTTYRYYWTAENEGLYDFAFTVSGAVLTYSTDEGQDGSLVSAISGYYAKGDTFYLTVRTDAQADGSFKAVIKKQDAQELKEGVDNIIPVDANGSVWVSFTSKKAEKVRYQYGKANADGLQFYKSTGLDDSDTSEVSFTEDIVLRPGQKVYYKIESSNAEATDVNLTVQPVALTEIIADAGTGIKTGTAANVETGANAWYHFHASNAGRYKISASSKAGETVSEINTFQVYESLTAETQNQNKTPFVKADKEIYIRVPNNGAKADITVTVTNMADAAASLSTGTAALTLKKGVPQYMVYDVPSTGYYSMSAADAEGKPCSMSMTYYVDNQSGVSASIPMSAKKLSGGSKVVFAVTASEDVNVTVTITQETLIDLTDNAETQTISAGKTLYFRMKTTKDIRYFIETTEVADGLTLSYSSVVGWMEWNNGYGDFAASAGQEEMIFGLTAPSSFDGTKTFKIKRGIVSPAEIKAGAPAESAELPAYHKVWYTFTPEKAGRYSIKANGATLYEYKDGITGYGSRVQTPKEVVITEQMLGKAVIYAVYHTDSTAAKKVSLSIAEVAVNELAQDKACIVDVAKVEAGENVWISFTAAEDGRYTFDATNTSVANSRIECYKTLLDGTYDSIKYYQREYGMRAGETFYFPVSFSTKPEENFTVSVSAVTGSSAQEISVSDAAVSVDVKAGEVKWLKFTPQKTANYKFEMTDVAALEQYDEILSDSGKSVSSNTAYPYAAGKTVYLKLTASSGLAEGTKPSVKITSEDMQELTEGENTINQKAEDVTEQYAFFAPSESGIFNFELADSTSCSIYVSGDRLYSSKKLVLDKTHPAYIRMAVTGSSANASAKIIITKLADIGEISAGGSADVTLTKDNNLEFYKFTAPEDGVYVFETDGRDKSVYVEVKNSINDSWVNPGYQCGSGGSYITEVKKGAVKYIRIWKSKNSLDSAGDAFTLTCKKAKEISFTNVDSRKLTLNGGDPVLVHWTFNARGNYEVGFMTTDEEIKHIDSESISPDLGWSYMPAYSGAYSAVYVMDFEERYLILEAANQTQVEVSAKAAPRKIWENNEMELYIDSQNRYEEFEMSIGQGEGGVYTFQTSNASQLLGLELTDAATGKTVTPDTVYWQENNCYGMYMLKSGQSYKLRVEPSYNSGEPITGNIVMYLYTEYAAGMLTSGDDYSTDAMNVQEGEEIWFRFTVKDSDRYGFDSNYNTYMNLYRLNGNDLELLGKKESGNSKIWAALDAGDTVLLQTYYYSHHGSGTYSINVTSTMPQTDGDNWSIDSVTATHDIYVERDCEYVIPMSFPNLTEAAAFAFTLPLSGSDLKNVEMALYKADAGNGTDKKELVGTGFTIACEIAPDSTYELRVRNYTGSTFSATIRAAQYTMQTITLEDNAKLATVNNGSEARFQFEVPADGIYLFYGTAEDTCDNYAELYVNGAYQTKDDDSGGNSQFLIRYTLSAGDAVELITYLYNHGSSEKSYTVHVEKVPEGYMDMTEMTFSQPLPYASIGSLAAGETVKRRFIAPAVSTDNGASYLFYSEMNSEARADLTVNVQLASEFSAYASEEMQKDEKGNCYNVYELTPGRPYILSVTNNGSDILNVGSIYASRYTELNGGTAVAIGGAKEQNEAVEFNIASGEETWMSYHVEEDGIFTFAVSDMSSYGYMRVFRSEGTELTSLNDSSLNNDKPTFEIYLSKGDNILVRIYQANHNALTGNVKATWEVWDITSVDTGSNTYTVKINASGAEGKVWLKFADSIAAGSYTISTTDTSAALKLYKNGVEETSDASQEGKSSVTFQYETGAVYQLGVTTSVASQVQLSITKNEDTPSL